MARLGTYGFESQIFAVGTGANGEGQNSLIASGGTATVDTSVARSGLACLKCAKAANGYFQSGITPVLGRTFYARFAFRFDSVEPSESAAFFKILDSTSAVFELTLQKTTKKLWSFCPIPATRVGVEAEHPTVSANVWYVGEVKWRVEAAGKGKIQYKFRADDGTLLFESAEVEVELRNTGVNQVRVGHFNAGETAVNTFHDDFVVNDDQGESQNTWPGNGKIVELKPVEDSTRSAGWLAPGGASTNLWKALDNRPPVGVIDSNLAESAEKQIRDVANNATDTYIAKCAAYSTPVAEGGGGLKESDTVTLVMARARGGNSTTTARTLAVRAESNPGPDAAEGTVGTGTTAAGTETSGWTTLHGTINYAPTVTLATKPGVRVRKGSASTNAALFDLVGLVVEYAPATKQTITLTPATTTDAAQAVTEKKLVTPTPAAEADAATARTVGKRVTLAASTETDAAVVLAVRKPIHVALVPSAEADVAQTLTDRKRVGLIPAAEIDVALSAALKRRLGITPAIEADAAQSARLARLLGLVAAVETDSGVILAWRRLLGLVPASEVDGAVALALASESRLTLVPAAEVDRAARVFLAGPEPPAQSAFVPGGGEGRIAGGYDGGMTITGREQGGSIGRDRGTVVR